MVSDLIGVAELQTMRGVPMARVKSTGIRETLISILPEIGARPAGASSAMVKRRRKVDPSAMLWTLLLEFSSGRARTLAGLRRAYQRVTGTALVPSARPRSTSPQSGPPTRSRKWDVSLRMVGEASSGSRCTLIMDGPFRSARAACHPCSNSPSV